jgi:Predicted solute binding protein
VKKEVKGFVMGVLMTSILLLGIPAFAGSVFKTINVKINTVKINMAGKLISVDNMTYKDKTYVDLAKFCDLLGKTAKLDVKKNIINITDKKVNGGKNVTPTPVPTSTPTPTPAPSPTSTPQITPSVSPDGVKPAVTSVNSLDGGTSVEIIFSEVMDKATAENSANYVLTFAYGNKSDVPVLSVSLDSTGKKVVLNTAGQQANTLYELKISNVKDYTGMTLDNYSQKFMGIKSNNPYLDSANEPLKIVRANGEPEKSVLLEFNKNLDQATAQDVASYSVAEKYGLKTHLVIQKAELASERNKVLLTFESAKVGVLYEVVVIGVKDESGNIIKKMKTTNAYGATVDTDSIGFVIPKAN